MDYRYTHLTNSVLAPQYFISYYIDILYSKWYGYFVIMESIVLTTFKDLFLTSIIEMISFIFNAIFCIFLQHFLPSIHIHFRPFMLFYRWNIFCTYWLQCNFFLCWFESDGICLNAWRACRNWENHFWVFEL